MKSYAIGSRIADVGAGKAKEGRAHVEHKAVRRDRRPVDLFEDVNGIGREVKLTVMGRLLGSGL
jgi:hypothetical protein